MAFLSWSRVMLVKANTWNCNSWRALIRASPSFLVAFRDGNCAVFWYFSSQITRAILNFGKLHSLVVAFATFNFMMLL